MGEVRVEEWVSGGVKSLEWRRWEVTNAELREVMEDRTAQDAAEAFK